ncbi:hypothetical protein [Aeribacillus pallidus]|uniref:hypothetical protein n=1 Tax=Aeribacillus pallidus TaxID=33936 RepID=UPI003D1E7F07
MKIGSTKMANDEDKMAFLLEVFVRRLSYYKQKIDSHISTVDCLFEIIVREEETIKELLLQEIKGKEKIGRGDFAHFLLRGLEFVRNNPIIRRVYFEGELDMLIRKLPKERIENHMEKDAHVLFPLLEEWEKKGMLKETNRDVIMSVIRAYYFAFVHEQQIGSEHILQTAQFLAEAIAEKLIKDKEQ